MWVTKMMTINKEIKNLKSLNYHKKLLKQGFTCKKIYKKDRSYFRYDEFNDLLVINVLPKDNFIMIESTSDIIPITVLEVFNLVEEDEDYGFFYDDDPYDDWESYEKDEEENN